MIESIVTTHQPHIVIPPDQWPRRNVYYYCPDCHNVFGLAKIALPICPDCKRVKCKDIFSEIALRLQHAWSFFEATRHEKRKWGLFRLSPSDKDYTLWASSLALGTYGELRCLGFELPGSPNDDEILNEWVNTINCYIEPETNLLKGPLGSSVDTAPLVNTAAYVSGGYAWQLNNRVFMPERYKPPAGTHSDIDHLRNKKAALSFLEDRDPEYGSWTKNPYGKGSWTTRVIENHIDLLKAKELPDDGMADFVRQWLDKKQSPKTGAWGGEECSHHITVNGIFKVFVSYERYGWPIQYKKEIVDFVLSGASENQGFGGSGCSVFDPMMVLGVIRGRGIDYRADEIDEIVAKTFLTFLENWDENHSWFKENNWNGKHNMGIVLYMAALLLDQPYMKICTIYNWRNAPIIKREKDGTVIVNKEVTYSKPGFPFGG